MPFTALSFTGYGVNGKVVDIKRIIKHKSPEILKKLLELQERLKKKEASTERKIDEQG